MLSGIERRLRRVLIDVASRGDTITYGEVRRQVVARSVARTDHDPVRRGQISQIWPAERGGSSWPRVSQTGRRAIGYAWRDPVPSIQDEEVAGEYLSPRTTNRPGQRLVAA